MKREERKIFSKCIAIMAVYIISATWYYTTPVSAEKAVLTDDSLAVDIFTAETDKTDLRAVFDENSAMPCVDRESFERRYATYEQETSEEVTSERAEVHEESEAECVYAEPTEEIPLETKIPLYAIDDQLLNPDLQEYLYQRLSDYQLEWFMPYAIMIAYQESKFNIYAENPNGLDKGLFQFRLPYYPGQDIFNPYEQIDIFCQQMANRSQYDVYEMISRHNVSDYGSYNATYVSQVLAHEANLREVN